jgi:hypothetical protein
MTLLDIDPVRPGVQRPGDIWRVVTTDGTSLVLALTAAQAEGAVTWAALTDKRRGVPPDIRAVTVAEQTDIDIFIADTAALLGVLPGPIPPDMLDDAEQTITPLRLAMYRNLTEKHPAEATDTGYFQPRPAPALRIPEQHRFDWRRGAYTISNLLWIGWYMTVYLAPVLIAIAAMAGDHAGMWELPDPLIFAPITSATVIWGVVCFAVSWESFYAHFNLWPDLGGAWPPPRRGA